MRDQHNDPLNDAVAREIEQALAVEPSPQFEARVRQRVAQAAPRAEAGVGWWRPALWPTTAVIASTVIVIAGWQFGSFFSVGDERASVAPAGIQHEPVSRQQQERSIASIATPQAATQSTAQSMAQAATQDATVRPGARSVQPSSTMATLDWLAPVIVAEDEIAGMRALIADAQAGRFESVVVTEERVAAIVAVVATPRATADASEEPASETTSASASDASGAEPAPTGSGRDMSQARLPQIASAVLVRPLVIEPLTIKPVVQSLPDETPEGVAE